MFNRDPRHPLGIGFFEPLNTGGILCRINASSQRSEISQEDVAIDRAVEDAGRVDPVVTERGNEGHGAPVSERSLGIERLATSAPTMGPRHVGLGPGFINEDQTFGIEPALNPLPERTLARDVRAILFTCEQGFF